jgi:hypothetical protein
LEKPLGFLGFRPRAVVRWELIVREFDKVLVSIIGQGCWWDLGCGGVRVGFPQKRLEVGFFQLW